ncbi:MAG TPA: hypothetical protein VHM28_05785 [Anaerolineales bacterium]|jgi:hypothetical protein|nr:hypothetical protein [Anaerolineales bacterium]
MDKNYFYQKQAGEHQREISKELVTRNLLRSARPIAPATMRITVRAIPAVITVIALILLIFAR